MIPYPVVALLVVAASALLLWICRDVAVGPDEDDPTVTVRRLAPEVWRIECLVCASTVTLNARSRLAAINHHASECSPA